MWTKENRGCYDRNRLRYQVEERVSDQGRDVFVARRRGSPHFKKAA